MDNKIVREKFAELIWNGRRSLFFTGSVNLIGEHTDL